MAAFALVLRGDLPETILDRPQYQTYFRSEAELTGEYAEFIEH